jgi:hypothetical protein
VWTGNPAAGWGLTSNRMQSDFMRTTNIRELPGFPVELFGVGEVHAVVSSAAYRKSGSKLLVRLAAGLVDQQTFSADRVTD